MSTNQGTISIEQMHIHLGQGASLFEAVQDVSLKVEAGEFI
jgi:ABC-type dipeptide/oligopeptide/nickel transport system ATPase subunit